MLKRKNKLFVKLFVIILAVLCLSNIFVNTEAFNKNQRAYSEYEKVELLNSVARVPELENDFIDVLHEYRVNHNLEDFIIDEKFNEDLENFVISNYLNSMNSFTEFRESSNMKIFNVYECRTPVEDFNELTATTLFKELMNHESFFRFILTADKHNGYFSICITEAEGKVLVSIATTSERYLNIEKEVMTMDAFEERFGVRF